MTIRDAKLAVAIVIVASIFTCAQIGRTAVNDCAVQGIVENAAGQPVPGAFVKLKNTERQLTFMVISQAHGHYLAANLPSGRYAAQAVGGAMQSEWSNPVEVAGGETAKLNLSLTAKRPQELAPSWPSGFTTEAEGYKRISLPAGDGKQIVATRCVLCHDVARVYWNRGDQERWLHIVTLMRGLMKASELGDLTDQEARVVTQYLATNFSAVPTPDPNSRLPMALQHGEATKYRVVQYEIATPFSLNHDVAVDPQGNGWIAQRATGKLGRLDAKTLLYTEVVPPVSNLIIHNLDIDPQGRAWFEEMAIDARWFVYDIKTGAWDVFAPPKGLTTNSCCEHVDFAFADGVVYAGGSSQIVKLNIATKKFSVYDEPTWVKTQNDVGNYGLAVSGDGNLWFAENAVDQMGRLDPETGKIEEFKIPMEGRLSPRRMGTDAAGDVWVGLWQASKLMKIDVKTGKMTFYDPPTKDGGPYYVSVDKKNNLIWVSLEKADKLDRFNPKTGEWVEFPLPEAESDVRKIEVDRTNANRIWWTGNLANRFGYIELVDETKNNGGNVTR